MDTADFHNSLATLGVSPVAAKGFEQEAYGAALLLIHYQDQLTPAGRQAFARRLVASSHQGQNGIQRGIYGQFFWQLNSLRLQTFFSAMDDESVRHRASLIDSPWSLTDRQFAYCIFTLREGRDPDPAKFEKLYLTGEARKIADKVENKARCRDDQIP